MDSGLSLAGHRCRCPLLIKCQAQNFLDPLDGDDREIIAHFLRYILQVLFVRLGKDDPPDSGAMRIPSSSRYN